MAGMSLWRETIVKGRGSRAFGVPSALQNSIFSLICQTVSAGELGSHFALFDLDKQILSFAFFSPSRRVKSQLRRSFEACPSIVLKIALSSQTPAKGKTRGEIRKIGALRNREISRGN